MEIWKYLIILSVTILLILIGSKVIYKDDYAVITGTVNGNGVDIEYPKGFTKDNCVCVCAMLQNPNNPNGTWGICNGGIFNSSSYVTGALPLKIVLSTKISIQTRNINISDGTEQTVLANSTTADFKYKVILMKI